MIMNDYEKYLMLCKPVLEKAQKISPNSSEYSRLYPQIEACQKLVNHQIIPAIPITYKNQTNYFSILSMCKYSALIGICIYFLIELVVFSVPSWFFDTFWKIIVVGASIIMLSSLGSLQVAQKGHDKVCDGQFFDFFSIVHFVCCLFITLIFMLQFSFVFSVVITIICSILYEWWEYRMQDVAYNFACEKPINQISDIIVNSLGALSAYFFTLF